MALQVLNLSSNVSGYKYTLTSATDGSQITGTVNGTTAAVPVPAGTYNLTLNSIADNSVLATSSVDTSQTVNVFTPVTSSTDVASSGVSSTPITSGSFGSTSTSAINIITPNTDSEEFVAPNSAFGKYFTCEDARLYIGNIFIDESIFVQFTLQDNKIPLYGYRSRFYDAMAQGHSIVQGQLGLNFVSEGYLYTALNNYKTLSATAATGDQARLNSLVYTENQILTRQKTNNIYTQDDINATAAASDTSQLAQIQAEKLKLVNKLGPTSLDTAQAYITSSTAPTPVPGKGYSNAIYLDVPFDLVLQLNGAQRSVTRRLEGCQLIANDQVIDSSGNTLSDGYSFIARRLR